MTTWLFVGSSATAPEALPRAIAEQSPGRTITCNSGIKLLRPDVYFCSDFVASTTFAGHAREAQAAGTHLVTLAKPEPLMESQNVEFYDERLTCTDGPPTREAWGRFRGSGPMCMEYALRHGATTLILVGCEGYRHDSPADYFDGDSVPRLFRRRKPVRVAVTKELIEPRTRELVTLYPEVCFICYGEPCYTVHADNWEVIPL